MEKISETARCMYHSAVKATGKITREIKIKAKMSENKRMIQEIYEDIGKTIYEKYLLKEEINSETDILGPCSKINDLADEVENLRIELLKLKDLKQCPKCHYEIYYDFHYCPNCGHIQEKGQNESKNDGPATITTTEEDTSLKHYSEEQFEEDDIEDLEMLDETETIHKEENRDE